MDQKGRSRWEEKGTRKKLKLEMCGKEEAGNAEQLGDRE